VGRDEELALVAGRLGGSAVAAVVIAGGAGVGKSRLLAAAADRARAGGVTVLPPVLATRAAASIPFGAVADLVPDSTASLTGMGCCGQCRLRCAAAGTIGGRRCWWSMTLICWMRRRRRWC
jgi:hypothetical protein